MTDLKFDTSSAPPQANRKEHSSTHHGIQVNDPYAWMRDDNWQTVMQDPSVLRSDIRVHLETENSYTRAVMGPLDALRDRIFEEMKDRLDPRDEQVPVPDGPYAYYHRYRVGDQHGLYARKPINADRDITGDEEVILDADALAKDHSGYFDIGAVSHSRDHARLAYSIDTKGSENYEIFVSECGGNTQSTGITCSTGQIRWAADNEVIFWIERDAFQRPSRVFARSISDSDGESQLIYEEADPGFFVTIRTSDSGDFILINSHNHTTSEIWTIPADAPFSDPVCFRKRESGLEYSIHDHGRYFYILTNADEAVDFKIMRRIIPDSSAEWEAYIPHLPGRLILSLEMYADHMVSLTRQNALPRLIIRDMETCKDADLPFGDEAYALGLPGRLEYSTPWLRYDYMSPTTPSRVYDYNMCTGEHVLRKTQNVPSGHDPDDYIAKRLQITARDGAGVPVTLLYHRDTKIDGTAPLLLYGYGAYGITVPARFRTSILSLVDRGFVYGIAHIRGGMSKGYQWYLDGKLETKINTFNDFVDAGYALCDSGYTSKGRIVACGGSAGGLLAGAALNQAPSLFAGAIAAVPFVDVLNTMLDDTLPLTPPEWPEWGNPREDKAAFERIAAYSPYDNTVDADYPPVLITGGLTDPRVTYWEPAKWAARLRDHQTGTAPIMLKMNMDAGHQGDSGRYDSLRDTALEYAFAVAAVGGQLPVSPTLLPCGTPGSGALPE
ncbi:MAG: S9 family peptidase [Hyphomonadaceae bacterium]|nr:S9 family peptidase [Hyphomonadaceae bacterium]